MERYVGVDIGGTKMYICAQVNGEYVEKKVPTGLDCKRETIKQALDEFISELPFEPQGVGMGVPGLINGHHSVEFSEVSDLSGVTAEYFSEGRFPLTMINDVKAATWAEVDRFQDEDTIAVIMAGTGLALGVYSKGQMITGSKGFAGELGYIFVPTPDGPKILDEVSGGCGILRAMGCSGEEVRARLAEQNEKACEVLNTAGEYFGMALNTVMHLFNPSVIVVGGSTSTYPGYMDKAIASAKKYTLEDIFNACTVTTPVDNKRIVALGAVAYLKRNINNL